MRRWAFTLFAAISVSFLSLGTTAFLSTSQADSASDVFVTHTLDTDLAGGYQVVVTDFNRDGRPDILALGTRLSDIRWYENPNWQKHVLITGVNHPVNAAAFDVDGDGIPEVALAHEFENVYAQGIGVVSILTHQGDPAGPWSSKEIDRVPTSHRLRFADTLGDGNKVLVNFPLIGSQAVAPDYRDHVSLLMYRPGEWKREVITDAEEGVVHGIATTPWNGAKGDALLSASFLGVHLLQYDAGRWSRTLLTKGSPAAWPNSGSGDVAVGTIGNQPFLATLEPFHGTEANVARPSDVVIYRPNGSAWKRHVVDRTIDDGHTIVTGDFDGDGRDEVVVGERQGRQSVYLYRLTDARSDSWSKEPVDDGGMAAAGCAVADLNADGSSDIVCIGTATANLKWYENRRSRR